MVSNIQKYIPLLYTVSAKVGVAGGMKEICPVKTCWRKLFLQDISLSVGEC